MFSSADNVGIRLYCWKMKPRRSRRSRVSVVLSRIDSSVSPMNAWPDVSRSSPAMQCMSVLLPDPDGPMIAVNRPVGKVTVTPASAWTVASPFPYVLNASTTRAAPVSTIVSVMRCWSPLLRRPAGPAGATGASGGH
jgi:hypothetical protein